MERKILVIEDDMDIANIVKIFLEDEPYTVEIILDPLVAFDKAKSYKPDAILLDLSMPKIDGWEIFKMLREDKDFDNVPIAILTAKTEEVDVMVGLHVMNADGYITKPFRKQELIDQINELFKKDQK